MRAVFHYKKWWHRFIPKYRHEKQTTEQIANFILKKYEKQIQEKAFEYIKDRLIYGRAK